MAEVAFIAFRATGGIRARVRKTPESFIIYRFIMVDPAGSPLCAKRRYSFYLPLRYAEHRCYLFRAIVRFRCLSFGCGPRPR
jgi:hypothetical protein